MSAADEIEEVNKEFVAAMAAGDAAGVAACYGEEAWFMVPGAETLKGRAAITAGVQGLIDSGITAIELTTIELTDLGDNAIEVGEYKLFADDNVADHGRFMVKWENVYGKWYLQRDIINSYSS